jgi:hypothetical protein
MPGNPLGRSLRRELLAQVGQGRVAHLADRSGDDPHSLLAQLLIRLLTHMDPDGEQRKDKIRRFFRYPR